MLISPIRAVFRRHSGFYAPSMWSFKVVTVTQAVIRTLPNSPRPRRRGQDMNFEVLAGWRMLTSGTDVPWISQLLEKCGIKPMKCAIVNRLEGKLRSEITVIIVADNRYLLGGA